MKERPVDRERAVVAHHQATEVPQPSERPLDRPAPFVASKNATILRRRPAAVRAVRRDQQDTAPAQPLPQRVAVIAFVGNYPQRFLPRTACTMPSAYADRGERRLCEPDFRRGRRTKVVPQRNSAAVDHHHPLRALAALGFPDRGAPFFAGAKLPSAKHSSQRSLSASWSSARNARHSVSNVPSASQSRSRRQHVVALPYRHGTSLHGAPVQSTHKIPSKHLRSSARGRPPCGERFGLGRCPRTCAHCASVSPRHIPHLRLHASVIAPGDTTTWIPARKGF
jgi:hypothetical protein